MLDLFMCFVIVAGFVAIFKYNLDRVAYCVGGNLICLLLIYDVAIGAGGAGGLFWLPVMPPFIFFFLERAEAVVSTVCFYCFILVILIFPNLLGTHPYELKVGIRYLIAMLFIIAVACGLESSRYRSSELLKQTNRELRAHREKLEQALLHVRTLSGLLPICSNCKKIRDDKGYWNQIESYIGRHSEAEFSHGICPDCVKKLYSDLKLSRRDERRP